MKGGRIAPHAARNPGLRARPAAQANFLRSSARLTDAVRKTARALTGTQLKELMPRKGQSIALEPTSRQRAAEAVFEMMKEIVEKGAPKLNEALADHLSSNSASADHYGRIAHGLGMLRDVDGNVIYLDDHERPYVRIQNDQIVYVKVYKDRITPSGLNLDAKCTVENPDGKLEVLLVEPVPVISLPDQPPI